MKHGYFSILYGGGYISRYGVSYLLFYNADPEILWEKLITCIQSSLTSIMNYACHDGSWASKKKQDMSMTKKIIDHSNNVMYLVCLHCDFEFCFFSRNSPLSFVGSQSISWHIIDQKHNQAVDHSVKPTHCCWVVSICEKHSVFLSHLCSHSKARRCSLRTGTNRIALLFSTTLNYYIGRDSRKLIGEEVGFSRGC